MATNKKGDINLALLETPQGQEYGVRTDLSRVTANAKIAMENTRPSYSQDTSATPASREILSMNPAQQGGVTIPSMEAVNALDTYHAQALQIMGRTFDQASGAATADKMNYNAKIVEGQKGGTIGQGASLVTAASNKYGSGYAVTPLAAPTKDQLAFGASGKASVALKGVSPDAVSPAAAPKMALSAVSPSPNDGIPEGAEFNRIAKADAARATAIPKWNPYTFANNALTAPSSSARPAVSTQSKNDDASRWEGDPAKFTSAKTTPALLEPNNINARDRLSTESSPDLDQQVGSALTSQYGKGKGPNDPISVTLGGKTVSIDRRSPVKSLRQFIYEAKQIGDNKAIDDYSKFMGTLNLKS